MGLTPNWSLFEHIRMAPRSTSSVCHQQHGPWSAGCLQPEVLIGRPSRSLHICSLLWLCPSPEPGSNSGMLGVTKPF